MVSVERDKCIVIVVYWAGWRVEQKRAWSGRVAAREQFVGPKEWQLELEYQEVGKVWGGTWGALWCWRCTWAWKGRWSEWKVLEKRRADLKP